MFLSQNLKVGLKVHVHSSGLLYDSIHPAHVRTI